MRFLRSPIGLTVIGVIVVGVILYILGFRMTQDDLFISARAEPLTCLGGTLVGEVCDGGVPFTNSLLVTLIVDAILIAIAFFVGQRLQLVPRGFQNVVEYVIEAFYNFALGVDRKNIAKFFPLPATIFLFFLVGNFFALIPGSGSIGNCVTVEEHATVGSGKLASLTLFQEGTSTEAAAPAQTMFRGWPGDCAKSEHHVLIPWFRAPAADLNVTLAFALVAVFMIEFYGFQALGVGYLGKFFINPFKQGAIMTFVGLLELFSEVMRIVAFAFRIFGNIFGGEVVLIVMSFLFPYLLPFPFYGLEVFVAFIQALIFAVLTLIFSSLAVQSHGHDEEGHPEPLEEPDGMPRAVAH